MSEPLQGFRVELLDRSHARVEVKSADGSLVLVVDISFLHQMRAAIGLAIATMHARARDSKGSRQWPD